MPRSIRISAPREEADQLVEELKARPGLLGLRVNRDASIQPSGDVIEADLTLAASHEFYRLLVSRGYGERPDVSVQTSEPLSLATSQQQAAIRDADEVPWEEMESVVAKGSNMTASALGLMALAGIIAILGIETNALHVVIGAMAIAPGFAPILRLPLGLVAKTSAWRHGLIDIGKAYAALVAGAAATGLLLVLMGKEPLTGEATYLPKGILVDYWTTISTQSVLISLAASIGGAILVATNRSVLTAGVMIALALIPAASIAGVAVVVGDWPTLGKAAGRWLIDAGLVALLGWCVLAWKGRTWHQRRSMYS
jgi:hypothetical protein